MTALRAVLRGPHRRRAGLQLRADPDADPDRPGWRRSEAARRTDTSPRRRRPASSRPRRANTGQPRLDRRHRQRRRHQYRVERCQGAGCTDLRPDRHHRPAPASPTPASRLDQLQLPRPRRRRRRQPRPLLRHRQRTTAAARHHRADRADRPRRDGDQRHPDQPRLDRGHRQRRRPSYRIERCQGAGCRSFTQIGTATGITFQRHRPHAGDQLQLPRPRRAPPATRAVLHHRQRHHGRRPTPTPDRADRTRRNRRQATQINLAWTASTDNVAVPSYRVERCQGAGCSTFAEIGTPPAPVSPTPAARRRHQLQLPRSRRDAAANLGPYSDDRHRDHARPARHHPPDRPHRTGATAASATQVNLAWTAATDNVGVPSTASNAARAPAAHLRRDRHHHRHHLHTTPAARPPPATATASAPKTPPPTSAPTPAPPPPPRARPATNPRSPSRPPVRARRSRTSPRCRQTHLTTWASPPSSSSSTVPASGSTPRLPTASTGTRP